MKKPWTFWILCGTVLAALHPSAAADAAADDAEVVGDRTLQQNFVIGVEDILQVVTWGEQDLTRVVQVRPDGKITLPLVNEILVAGLTTEQARVKIAEALTGFVRDPNVTVIVQSYLSFRVYFLGEVKSPGAVQFQRPIRILQALATVGGLTEFSKKEIILLREEDGVEKRININYKRLLAGEGDQNIALRPGDTLLVN